MRAFEILARVARKDAGLVIPPEKAPMVFARVTKRLRALGIQDLAEYCKLIDVQEGKEERRLLISTLTTNVTSFFRERHHFDTLAEDIMPRMIERARSGKRVRIWSAGCSTGQEPYSIAMILLENIPEASKLDVKVLATDIDPVVLQVARSAIYNRKTLEPLTPDQMERFLETAPSESGKCDELRIRRPVTDLVSFRELNLLASWPMRRQFDAIFCRNVVIYFDRETQCALWPRFEQACRPGGHLFLGHSERLDEGSMGTFRSSGTTTYCRSTAK